jgi:hypothetical protein
LFILRFSLLNFRTRDNAAGGLHVQMHILSRLYPCKECGDHFKEVLK